MIAQKSLVFSFIVALLCKKLVLNYSRYMYILFILLCHSRNSNIYLMPINHLWQNIYFLIVLISRHKISDCIAFFMNFSLTLVHHDYNVDYFVRKFSRYICTNSCLGLHPGSHHIRYGKCDAHISVF